jgi:hypothetical protein
MILALVSSLSRCPQHQVNQYIQNSELEALNIFKIPKVLCGFWGFLFSALVIIVRLFSFGHYIVCPSIYVF